MQSVCPNFVSDIIFFEVLYLTTSSFLGYMAGPDNGYNHSFREKDLGIEEEAQHFEEEKLDYQPVFTSIEE